MKKLPFFAVAKGTLFFFKVEKVLWNDTFERRIFEVNPGGDMFKGIFQKTRMVKAAWLSSRSFTMEKCFFLGICVCEFKHKDFKVCFEKFSSYRLFINCISFYKLNLTDYNL